MTLVIVYNTLPDGLIGCLLILLRNGCINIQSACIGFILVLVVYHHADHFCHVLGMDTEFVSARSYSDFLIPGLFIFLVGDITELFHSEENILLALSCPCRIGDRIIGGRRLGQTCQHGRFSQSDVLERFPEIDLCSGSETESALPQINLVQINFENLVLGQCFFDFPG